MRTIPLTTVVLGSVILAACSTVGPPPADGPPPAEAPAGSPSPAEPPEPSTSGPPDAPADQPARLPASVRALVADAEVASSAGRHGEAASKLERALRIAPRNAVIWQNLAVVRYRQNRCGEAVNLAQRSNDLASGARRLRADNWRLIGACRKVQGDAAGAREAAAHAQELGGRP